MTVIKNVALIGASGNLGPSILNAFLKNGSFNISVLSRQSSSATFPSSVKVFKIDFSYDSLVSAFKGQDAVVSIAGGGQLSDQQKYIDAAIEAGVKRFIPSEFGNDTTNPKTTELVPLFKPKAATTEYLASKESETFSWTAIATGPFFDWGMKVGFLGFDLKKHTATIWDDGSASFSTTNLATIGDAVVRSLLPEHVEQTKNSHVYVHSHNTTQGQILATLEKITDEKWPVQRNDSAPLLQELTAKLKAGNFGPEVIYPLIQTVTFGSGLGNLGDHSTKSWNEKLGLPKEDLEANLRELLAA
ncbi:uncharacterized protein PV09_03214 [Verruconis gallopava]|uniref:NmrA-like domain-containing protein n=1 Tax=Verruconis gallopava TaxID=253628 RepID=A0A0D2AGK0_9PEZI|nr:uncharacterized protein PV09_03214 [Verruconis gallopava]KIW06038.1 hypothetical protein PV09_03214 [Verruconis gallopava]